MTWVGSRIWVSSTRKPPENNTKHENELAPKEVLQVGCLGNVLIEEKMKDKIHEKK
jgi:hypothetical protein